MPFDSDRHVPLQGALNFRDVGGLATADGRRVRRRVLFRSDALSRLTDADLRVVSRLGLRTIVDLRSAQERASEPDRVVAAHAPRSVHLPMRDPSMPDSRLWVLLQLVWHGPSTDFAAVLQKHFRAFAFECPESVGGLLRLLADPENLPAVVHCTAGKDRTGFTMAALLLMLGVPMHDVLQEHLATNELLRGSIPRYVRSLRWFSLGRLQQQHIMPLLEARAEHIEQVIGEVRERYGSIQAWMQEHCGVDRAAQDRIAAALLT